MTRSTGLSLIALLGLLLAACPGEESPPAPSLSTPPGPGTVAVVVRPLAGVTTITAIHVELLPAVATADLVADPTDGSFAGELTAAPGTYSLLATAYAGAAAVGVGRADDVVVVEDQTTAVYLTITDATALPPQPDHAPIITALVVSSLTVEQGLPVTLAATAVDPDGDALAWAWTDDCASGNFADSTTRQTTWTNSAVGTCRLTVAVTAGGLGDSLGVDILTVAPAAATGAIDVNGRFIPRPVIETMVVSDGVATCVYDRFGSADSCALDLARVPFQVTVETELGTTDAADVFETPSSTCGSLSAGVQNLVGTRLVSERVWHAVAPPLGEVCDLTWLVGNTAALVDSAKLYTVPAAGGRVVVAGEGGQWYKLALGFERIPLSGPDGFTVTATLTHGGIPTPGKSLAIELGRGVSAPVVDHGDGRYSFAVSPAGTGVYPVTVSVEDAAITRSALVLPTVADGVGQAVLVPGMVNTDGYEDGAAITPDGNYLFIQYGPLYFSGMFLLADICAEAGWSMYNLTTCDGKPDSDMVFQTIGPYDAPLRPDFPTGAIVGGELAHIGITIPTVASGIARFPTVFYGFKRQPDGTFGEPFKTAFDDPRGTAGPFGVSFQMRNATEATVVFAWDNYYDNQGDDKPDIYHGVVTMGVTNTLGTVTYAGQMFDTITPNVAPVAFTTHVGVQGNPHLYVDGGGTIRSIWTDDEQLSHDITPYRLTAGTFPDGTWAPMSLPVTVNSAASESQPFFSGSHLLVNREVSIVAHAYLGSGHGDYDQSGAWGPEEVLLASGDATVGGIYGVGEPTLARTNGKTLLYFIYVENRAMRPSTRYDINTGVAVVEIPARFLP
jgi:hypothetical protein